MMENLIPVDYVNLDGKPVNLNAHGAVSRPRREPSGEWHKGFLVVGHAPGACAAAQVAHVEAQRRYLGMASADRKRLNARDPGLWDEDRWRKRTRKARIAKPFEVPQAADELAAMARKAGWEDVEVQEMAKRQ